MRFTERELTVALEGAAKSMLAVQDKTVRKKQRTADEAWEALTKYQRFQLLDGLGDQLLPVAGLAAGRRGSGRHPADVHRRPDRRGGRGAARRRGPSVKGLKRKVLVQARIALVKIALEAVPPRQDPDALIVPDHL